MLFYNTCLYQVALWLKLLSWRSWLLPPGVYESSKVELSLYHFLVYQSIPVTRFSLGAFLLPCNLFYLWILLACHLFLVLPLSPLSPPNIAAATPRLCLALPYYRAFKKKASRQYLVEQCHHIFLHTGYYMGIGIHSKGNARMA